MTFWRGGLFSSYFLTEGAPGLADYHAIDDATVDALGATLAQRIAALMAMRAPNEAQTESDLIAPVLDALGWRGLYAVQAKVQRAHGRSRLSAVRQCGREGGCGRARQRQRWV